MSWIVSCTCHLLLSALSPFCLPQNACTQNWQQHIKEYLYHGYFNFTILMSHYKRLALISYWFFCTIRGRPTVTCKLYYHSLRFSLYYQFPLTMFCNSNQTLILIWYFNLIIFLPFSPIHKTISWNSFLYSLVSPFFFQFLFSYFSGF